MAPRSEEPRKARCLRLAQCGLAVCLLAGVPSGLVGCGRSNEPPSPSPTPAPPSPTPSPSAPYNCATELQIPNPQMMTQKGLCIDDTSLFDCPGKLPQQWPHTEQPIQYARLFKAFRPTDSEDVTTNAREKFVAWAKSNNVKVLVGSQITCNETDDALDWGYVQQLVQALGKDHVLALAVGNELDQLNKQPVEVNPPGCLDRIWGGYLLKQTQERIKWARDTLGNPELPVTSVYTTAIIWFTAGDFPDLPFLMVKTYFTDLLNSGEKHFVFTMNAYPIFDPFLKPDDADPTKCDNALQTGSCFDPYGQSDCKTITNLYIARQTVRQFMSSNPAWSSYNGNAPLWVGEIGWSSPMMATYDGAMKTCPDFFSKHMLYLYYKNFLQWDLKVHDVEMPPEMVFYFTMRDASNFGNQEHFGLIETCESTDCKMSPADVNPPQSKASAIFAV